MLTLLLCVFVALLIVGVPIGFAMLGGWLMFNHIPDQWSTIGVILIAICGLASAYLTLIERRRFGL